MALAHTYSKMHQTANVERIKISLIVCVTLKLMLCFDKRLYSSFTWNMRFEQEPIFFTCFLVL